MLRNINTLMYICKKGKKTSKVQIPCTIFLFTNTLLKVTSETFAFELSSVIRMNNKKKLRLKMLA